MSFWEPKFNTVKNTHKYIAWQYLFTIRFSLGQMEHPSCGFLKRENYSWNMSNFYLKIKEQEFLFKKIPWKIQLCHVMSLFPDCDYFMVVELKPKPWVSLFPAKSGDPLQIQQDAHQRPSQELLTRGLRSENPVVGRLSLLPQHTELIDVLYTVSIELNSSPSHPTRNRSNNLGRKVRDYPSGARIPSRPEGIQDGGTFTVVETEVIHLSVLRKELVKIVKITKPEGNT